MIFPKMMAAGKAETVDFKRKEVPEMLREKIRKKDKVWINYKKKF